MLFEQHARSTVDPTATPTPIATEADLQPLPALNMILPNNAPVAAPTVAFIIPDSITFSIPSGNFQLLFESLSGWLFVVDISMRRLLVNEEAVGQLIDTFK